MAIPVRQPTMTGFGYQAARRVFGLSNDAAFRNPTFYPMRPSSNGKPLIMLPRMMEANYVTSFAKGRLSEEVKETLWTAMQLTSRAAYRWLSGKTIAMDQGGYARSFIRRGKALPPDRPDLRLPLQVDPRYLPAGTSPDAAHLRDSVIVSDDKTNMRSIVTHTREAYWAYFVEYGTVKMGAQPRWTQAAREARMVYLDAVTRGIDAQLLGQAVVAEISEAMSKRLKGAAVPYMSASVNQRSTARKPMLRGGTALDAPTRPLMGIRRP